ncbi:MAG: DUF368 domain-containing protein [Halobacteriota archaeon]|nr:DUF368 domain-containing protein [Halobacteriota archaeon]
MKDKEKRISRVVDGFFIGIANTTPISGATVALILGVYEELIDAAKEMNIRFLIPIVIGVVIGLLAGVEMVVPANDNYPLHLSAFFVGLVLVSIYRPIGECKKRGPKELLSGVIGVLVPVIITLSAFGMSNGELSGSLPFWYLFVCGFFSLMAMAIPGVSGSVVLIILGAYIFIMETVDRFLEMFLGSLRDLSTESILGIFRTDEFSALLIFGFGAIFGLVAAIFAVSSVIKEHRDISMPFFVGMIGGSLLAVSMPLIESPEGITIYVLLSFFAGIIFVSSLLVMERRLTELTN